jgi:hypothetical protein
MSNVVPFGILVIIDIIVARWSITINLSNKIPESDAVC